MYMRNTVAAFNSSILEEYKHHGVAAPYKSEQEKWKIFWEMRFCMPQTLWGGNAEAWENARQLFSVHSFGANMKRSWRRACSMQRLACKGRPAIGYLYTNFGFLLGSFLLILFIIHCVFVFIGIIHFGIAAASATTTFVRRIIFFCNIWIWVSAEVFINRFFIFVSGATVRPNVIVTREVVVLEGCCNECSGLMKWSIIRRDTIKEHQICYC